MRNALRLVSSLLIFSGSLLTGCSVSPLSLDTGCTATPFIDPGTVTLDHLAKPPANSVDFTTGITNTGNHCATPAVPAMVYYWSVSNSAAATITSPGGLATCTAAASAPITVNSLIPKYTLGMITGFIPSGLPNATLICQ